MTEQEFRADLRAARASARGGLRACASTAYRAPEWSLRSTASPHLATLVEEGFRVDSSLLAVPPIGDPGNPRRPTVLPTRAGDLLEVPPLVGTFFGRPAMLGGGWTSRLSREARVTAAVEAALARGREPRSLPPPVGGGRGAPADGALADRPARPLRRARRASSRASPASSRGTARPPSPRRSRPAPSGGRWRREVRGALPGAALGEGGNGRGARRRLPVRRLLVRRGRRSGPGSTSRRSSSARGAPDLHDDLPAQVGVFAVSVAVLDVLAKEHGLAPAACAGYSLGTYAAFVGAGVLDRRAALDVLLEAERLLRERAPAGTMGFVIGVPEAEVAAELARLTRRPARGRHRKRQRRPAGRPDGTAGAGPPGPRPPRARARSGPRSLPLGWPMHSPALEPVTDGLAAFVAAPGPDRRGPGAPPSTPRCSAAW